MVSISKNIVDKRVVPQGKKTTTVKNKPTIWKRYLAYAERQDEEKILWYMKVIMFIPCVVMVISIIAMAMVTSNYIWFVGLNMILFFTNVVVHISQIKSTTFVPLYHFTIALLTVVPIITYFVLA